LGRDGENPGRTGAISVSWAATLPGRSEKANYD